MTSLFNALSHPARLAVFRLLMRRYPQQVRAGEIAQVLKLKPSTTSVYLSVLTSCGLITQERHGTSILYRADISAIRGFLAEVFEDCCSARADICPEIWPSISPANTDRPFRVLFLCTGNAARSLLAEAILTEVGGKRFAAYSAGTRNLERPNPHTVALLSAKGFRTDGLRSKNLQEFQVPETPRFDFIFIVCDLAANEDCGAWPGQPISANWGLADPAKTSGNDDPRAVQRAFSRTFDMLFARITAFCGLPFETLDRASLQRNVDAIALGELPVPPETDRYFSHT